MCGRNTKCIESNRFSLRDDMVHFFVRRGKLGQVVAIHTVEQVIEETDMSRVRYGIGELEMFGGHGLELATDR